MRFDLSSAALRLNRAAPAAALAALAAAISLAAPAAAQIRLEGVQSPADAAAQISAERAAAAGFAADQVVFQAGTASQLERRAAAETAARLSANAEWLRAVSEAFFRPGAGTCFRGQADGLVTGTPGEGREMQAGARSLAERSSVQIVVSFLRADGTVVSMSHGTGTVIRNRAGGENRILTAAHVARPEMMGEENGHPGTHHAVPPGGSRVAEVWTTDAAGNRRLFGTASLEAVGTDRISLRTREGIGGDWAVMRLVSASPLAAAEWSSLGLDVATDLSPRPFAADMGTPYTAGGRGDLLPRAAIPGRVPTSAPGTGQSGAAFLVADADGVPRVHGLYSADLRHVAPAMRFAHDIPVPRQRGHLGDGVAPTGEASVSRHSIGLIQHIPEAALRALGVSGWAIPTENARVLRGTDGFTAGYSGGFCTVSAGFARGAAEWSRNAGTGGFRTPKFRPFQDQAFYAAGSTWVPDDQGRLMGRFVPGQGFDVLSPMSPARPEPANAAALGRFVGGETRFAGTSLLPRPSAETRAADRFRNLDEAARPVPSPR